MPFPRYKNFMGIVTKMQGKNYVVKIKDGGVTKFIICGPAHLVKTVK